MESLTRQLKELITINRRIMNTLNNDEASVEYLQQAFDNREVYVRRLDEIVTLKLNQGLSEEEKATLKPLFERFGQQCDDIQEAISYILDKAQEKLGDAVKSRKAEQGYNALR